MVFGKGGEAMKIKNMTRCALMASAMTLCAWTAVPVGSLAVSLQTLGLFLTLGLLGGRLGVVTVAVYLSLGAMGAPVFTGLQGGFGALLGPTGGYLWGFFAAALLWWALEGRLPRTVTMGLSLLVCYLCGTVWYAWLTATGLWAAVLVCVLPFVAGDAVKMGFAGLITSGLKKRGIWRD